MKCHGWTAIQSTFRLVFLRRSIHTTGESQLGDIQPVLQEFIDDLDHALDGHGLFRDDQTAIRIGCGQFGLECGAKKLLLPVNQCSNIVVGTQDLTLSRLMDEAVELLRSLLN